MKTLLIPVDFSASTENVITYAAGFSCDSHVDRIILLKSVYVSMYAQLLPSPDFVQLSAEDIDEERRSMETNLNYLRHEMYRKCMPTIKIDLIMSEQQLVRAVHDAIASEKPNIVMIGTDQAKEDDTNHIAEEMIAIGRTSPVPVMFIPGHVKYRTIETALVPCKFETIARLSALQNFRDPKKWLHPKLMVLSVDAKPKQVQHEGELAANLVSLLEGYEYKVYYSEDGDVVHGVLAFAKQHDPEIIVALPGQYSFFYDLTHRNITKALTLNARRPVLILK